MTEVRITRIESRTDRGRQHVAAADALATLDAIRAGPTSGTNGSPERSAPIDGSRRRAAIRTLDRRGLLEREITRLGLGWRAVSTPPPGFVLAVDIGGTSTRASLADHIGELLSEQTEPTTHSDLHSLLGQVTRLYEELRVACGRQEESADAAAIGIPGSFDPDHDRVWNVGNLPILAGSHPSAAFGAALGLPVTVLQDVRLAALGERWRGLARGADDFAVLWVGTGIAMGLVAGGSLLAGGRHMAGEISRLPLGEDPFDERHRLLGAFEDAVSGPALARSIQTAIPGSHAETDARLVFDLASRGDERAIGSLRREASLLALAIASIGAVADPAIFVLGGGIGSRPELLPLVREEVARLVEEPPAIETSALGDRSPIYGGVALALSMIGRGAAHQS